MNPLLLAASPGTPPLLDPHGPGLVFWTGLIFACVALLLYKVAWGPLLEALEKREERIVGAMREAEEIKAQAEAVKRRYEEQLEQVRQEAQGIIDEGEADKKRILAEAHERAGKEAAEIRDRSEREVELAKTKALAELKQKAAALGLLIAERVIGAEVDAKKHQALIDDVVQRYERS